MLGKRFPILVIMAALALCAGTAPDAQSQEFTAVTCNNDCFVYVYDSATKQLVWSDQFGNGWGAYGVAFGPAAELYVSDIQSRNVYRYEYLGGEWGNKTLYATCPYPPADIEVDSSGSLYIAAGYDLTIDKIAYSSLVDTWAAYHPSQLSFGPAGKLWMALRWDDEQVLRFPLGGGASDLAFQVPNGSGITRSPDGRKLYATKWDSILCGSVKEYNPANGSIIGDFVQPGAGGLGYATGICFGKDRDADGISDLYVVDVENNVVKIYRGTDGGYIEDFASVPDPRMIATFGPVGLAGIDQAKLVADNTPVRLTEKIAETTQSDFSGFFYIEEQDRSSGIRVAAAAPAAHTLVTVTGVMATTSAGERQIANPTITIGSAHNPATPLGMNNRSLGGGNLGDPVNGMGQYGVMDGSGTNNVGLMVRAWGMVVETGIGYLKIDDGSGALVRVDTSELTAPPTSGFVTVSGISSLYGTCGSAERLILPTELTVAP